MSDFEDEEAYSNVFNSLNHPVRRKIIRMLSEKPRSFSEMFEFLGISSSHFNYHLESLGDLVSKTIEGKYKLSYLGEAAITTMIKVEGEPKLHNIKHQSPFIVRNWKPVILVFIIGFALLAGISFSQQLSLTTLSDDNDKLFRSNELFWDRYTSIIFSSENSPPTSKVTAIQKALQYGKWNIENLQEMVVDATLVYFKFGVAKITVLPDDVISEFPVARMYEVTETLSDYSPVSDENTNSRYIWEVDVRPLQDYLDSTFSNQPSGIYHIDAYTGEIYPNLYSLMYLDGE